MIAGLIPGYYNRDVTQKTIDNHDAHKELANFSNYLRKKGMKITNQRLLVAETIFNSRDHFTVDSLADTLKDRKDEISRATIYRIVSLMVEAGNLNEHNFGQNARYYEYIPGHEHHDHIVCQDCGYIEEFYDDRIEKIQKDIAQTNKFHLADHTMILYGSCQELAKQGKCSRQEESTTMKL